MFDTKFIKLNTNCHLSHHPAQHQQLRLVNSYRVLCTIHIPTDVPAIIRDGSIKHRHVFTQQTDLSSAGMYLRSRRIYQAPARIYAADRSIKRRHVYTQQTGIYNVPQRRHCPRDIRSKPPCKIQSFLLQSSSFLIQNASF